MHIGKRTLPSGTPQVQEWVIIYSVTGNKAPAPFEELTEDLRRKVFRLVLVNRH